MEKRIAVDIIIPCYNGSKFLEQSILSALNQTYDNTKVFFVDNESTDDSLLIAKKMQKQYPQLVVLQAPNLYEYSWQEPIAVATENCKGDYFTILAADDYIDSDYIARIVSIVEKSEMKIKVLQSPILGFSSQTNNRLDGLISHSYSGLEEFRKLLFKKCPVTTPTVFYCRELYDNGLIQWKSELYKGSGDYNCYFNLTDNNIFIYPIPVWLGYHYRWHKEQSTWGMQKNFNGIDLKIKEFWKQKWGVL